MKIQKLILVGIAFNVLTANSSYCQSFTAQQKTEMTYKVKEACKHAWQGYKQYANGYDALMPLTKQGRNWYPTSMLMTPTDAFDTFTLLNLKDEANESKELIFSKLNFNVDQSVQVFEMTIRMLGGLMSAYELDGDKKFLLLAEDLGKRMLPAFKSPTGMPYRFVNLANGKTNDSISNPAEIGTLMLEFGKLSQLTKDSVYYKTAKNAIMQVYKLRSKIDLVGTELNIETGKWTDTNSHVSGAIDSYYEYLYKSWLLFGDKDFKTAWDISNAAVKKHLLSKTANGWYFTHVDMNSGKETFPEYGALDAFYAGLLALSGDTATAKQVQKANFYMWTKFNIEPEAFNFKMDTITYNGYPLRPENIESCFYLYRFTHDEKYLLMGKRMVDDILTKCKTDAGYAAMKNVLTGELRNSMESFFFAETMKYSYLLFADESRIDLNKIVFNTEAHPLKIK